MLKLITDTQCYQCLFTKVHRCPLITYSLIKYSLIEYSLNIHEYSPVYSLVYSLIMSVRGVLIGGRIRRVLRLGLHRLRSWGVLQTLRWVARVVCSVSRRYRCLNVWTGWSGSNRAGRDCGGRYARYAGSGTLGMRFIRGLCVWRVPAGVWLGICWL